MMTYKSADGNKQDFFLFMVEFKMTLYLWWNLTCLFIYCAIWNDFLFIVQFNITFYLLWNLTWHIIYCI